MMPHVPRTYRYHRVDVFTDQPLTGNPLAVFPDARGLDTDEMLAIAREMNLSETVFCLPPSNSASDIRLRIFTIDRELPLAGHPVVGTHFVLAATGRYTLAEPVTIVRTELLAGIFPAEVLVEAGLPKAVVMTQRTPCFAPTLQDLRLVAEALGLRNDQVGPGDLPARVVDTGVPWLVVPVVDLRALAAISPDPALCRRLSEIAGTDLIYAFTLDTNDQSAAARARHVWFGNATPGEDPVTGSAAGCLASYLVFQGVLLAAPKVEVLIEQGVEVGRRGLVSAFVDAVGTRVERVRVGGSAVHVGDGELRIG